MSKPKEYILQIQDLLDIPENRFDAFIIDLKHWHKAARDTRELLKVIAKATGEPTPPQYVTMKWVDDGKHTGKITIQATEVRG